MNSCRQRGSLLFVTVGILIFFSCLLLISGSSGAADLIIDGTVHVCTGDEDHDSNTDVWILNGGELHTGDYSQTFGHVVVNASSFFYGNDSATVNMSSLTVASGGDCTLTSRTTMITSRSATSNPLYVHASGTLDDSDGLIHFSYVAENGIVDLGVVSTHLYDVQLTYGAKFLSFRPSGVIIDGDVTVSSGIFRTYQDGYALTVLGDTIVSGGTLGHNIWFGTFTTNSLTIESGGTYEAPGPGGETVITGESGAGRCIWSKPGSTFSANNGVCNITTPATTQIEIDGTGNLYNLIVSKTNNLAWAPTAGITIDGNVYVNAGLFYAASNVIPISIVGDLVVNSTMGQGDGSGAWTVSGSVLINAGGQIQGTSGIFQIGGDFTNNGDWDCGTGTVLFSGNDYQSELYGSFTSGNEFYNIHLSKSGSYAGLSIDDLDVDIQHDLTADDDSILYRLIIKRDNILTFGTSSYASQISNLWIDSYDWTTFTIQSDDESYPAVFASSCSLKLLTHTTYDIGTLTIKWLNIQDTITTPGDSVNLILDGDCTFDDLTISTGDTLDLNGFKLTSSSTVTISSGGSIVPGGEIEATTFTTSNSLTIASGQTFILENTTTATVTGALTIDSGGVLEAPGGDLRLYDEITNNGDYINSDGRMHFKSGAADYEIKGDFDSFDPLYNLYVTDRNLKVLTGTSSTLHVQHDITGSKWLQFASPDMKLLLGTSSYASQVTCRSILAYGGILSFYVEAVSEDYPANIDLTDGTIYFLEDDAYSPDAGVYLKWVVVADDLVTGNSDLIWILGGDSSFAGITHTGTLDLNGYRIIINGTFVTDGTLTTGTTSAIELTDSGSWTVNQNLTLQEIEVDGSIDISGSAGCKNITFTGSGFANSSGMINVTGSAGDLVHIYAADEWKVNASTFPNYQWYWLYVNLTNGNNTGAPGKYLTVLGENNSCIGFDFRAPLIVPTVVSDYATIKTAQWTNFGVSIWDLSIIHNTSYKITRVDTGEIIESGEVDYTSIGEVSSYQWNQYYDTTGWDIWDESGDKILYKIQYWSTDTHNKPTSEKEKSAALDYKVNVNGFTVDSKIKKVKDVDGNYLMFLKASTHEGVWALQFMSEQKVKNTVTFTDDLNFKMSHIVKPERMDDPRYDGVVGSPQIVGVKIRIKGWDVQYLENSRYYGHFLFYNETGGLLYYLDWQDWKDQGGELIVGERVELTGGVHYECIITNSSWVEKKNYEVDPVSGVINSDENSYFFYLEPSDENRSTKGQDTVPRFQPLSLNTIFAIIIGALVFIYVMIIVQKDRNSQIGGT